MNNKYTNIFNEIIDHETYKKHVKPDIDTKSSEYKSQLKKILKTFFTEKGSKMPKRNLTIPYNSLKVTTLKNIDKQIIEYLNDNGFKCDNESYEIGMCTNPKGKQVSIYNILKQINEYNTDKLKKQLNEIDNDKAKEAIQKKIKQKETLEKRYLTHYSRINKMMNRVIVFTWVPRKIASQSTNVAWDSCLKLFNGSFRHFVPSGIEAGQFIAYLVTKGDENKLDKPMARLTIKPFVTKKGTVFWYPQSVVYPKEGNEKGVNQAFKNKVIKFIKDRQKLKFSEEELENAIKLYGNNNDTDIAKKQHDDGDTKEGLKTKFSEQQRELVLNKIKEKIDNKEKITFDDLDEALRAKFNYKVIKKMLNKIESDGLSLSKAYFIIIDQSLKSDNPKMVSKLLQEVDIDSINRPMELVESAKRKGYKNLSKKIKKLHKESFIKRINNKKVFTETSLEDAVLLGVSVDIIKKIINNSDIELKDIYNSLKNAKRLGQKNIVNFLSQYYNKKTNEKINEKIKNDQELINQDFLDMVRGGFNSDSFEKIIKDKNFANNFLLVELMEEAIQYNNKEIFFILAQKEKSKEALKDITGYALLQKALKNDKAIAKKMIENDYIDFERLKISKKESYGELNRNLTSILAIIVRKKYYDILEILFDKEELNLSLKNENLTDLIINQGDKKIFEIFLDNEKKLNVKKILRHAARDGRNDFINLILERISVSRAQEILNKMIEYEQNHIARIMLRKVETLGKQEILSAATARNFEILKVLLQDKRLKKLDKDVIADLQDLIGKNKTNELIQNYFHGNIEESFSYSINEINKIFR